MKNSKHNMAIKIARKKQKTNKPTGLYPIGWTLFSPPPLGLF